MIKIQVRVVKFYTYTYLTTVTDPKLRKALTMYRLSEHISLLLRKAAVGRTGSQEKTGYVHTAHKMRWKLNCTS